MINALAVIAAPLTVIPAKAGTQSSSQNFVLSSISIAAGAAPIWVPAYAVMTAESGGAP